MILRLNKVMTEQFPQIATKVNSLQPDDLPDKLKSAVTDDGNRDLKIMQVSLDLLSENIKKYFDNALQQLWPFMPPIIVPDMMFEKNPFIPKLCQADLLLTALNYAIECSEFRYASALAFVVDRFMYWYGGSEVLLKIIDHILVLSPSTVIAPQLTIRRARIMKDNGNLHGAIEVLDGLIDSKAANEDGQWHYRTEFQYINVYAVCVQIKGQIYKNLGLWKEAVPLLLKSVEEFEKLPDKDLKGISYSYGLLSHCLCKLSHKEYLELQNIYVFQRDHPCYEAFEYGMKAAELSPKQSLFFARHCLQSSESLLMYAVQVTDLTQRKKILADVIVYLQKVIFENNIAEISKSKEQLFIFIKGIYVMALVLGCSNTSADQYFGDYLEKACLYLYRKYSLLGIDGLESKRGGDIFKEMLPAIKILFITLKEPTIERQAYFITSFDSMKTSKIEEMEDNIHNGCSLNKEYEKTRKEREENYKQSSYESKLIATLQNEDRNSKEAKQRVSPVDISEDSGIVLSEERVNKCMVDTNVVTEVRQDSCRIDCDTVTKERCPECMADPNAVTKERDPECMADPNAVTKERGPECMADPNAVTKDRDDRCGVDCDAITKGRSNECMVDSNAVIHKTKDKCTRDSNVSHANKKQNRRNVGLHSDLSAKDLSNMCLVKVNYSVEEEDDGVNVEDKINDGDGPAREEKYQGSVINRNAERTLRHARQKQYEERKTTRQKQLVWRDFGEPRILCEDGKFYEVYHVPPKVQDEPILTFLYNNQDGSILTQLTLDNIGKTDLTYDVHDGDPNFNWSDEQCDNLDKQIINRLQKAVLYHYNPVTSMWYIQDTIVYISKELSVGKKGGFRDVYEMNFLHQDEPLGRYICKRYRKEKDPLDYIDDVKCQMEAGLYVTYFNQALKSYQSDIRIHYLPAAYMHLLDANGDVEFWVNIEPFVKGEFLKLTNNYDYCNPRGCDMSTAFTHFTYFKSAGKLMVVDLQGWLPSGVQNIIYLTDPQFHTVTGDSSTFDFGIDGFKVFFNKVHPKCNHICETLKLERPDF